MNNKGQSTVMFIILIPLFLIAIAFIFDNAMILIENKRYDSVTKSIMKDAITNSYSDKVAAVKKLYEKNKLETDSLECTYDGEDLIVFNIHNYDSFFGKVMGQNTYRTEVYYDAHYDDDGKDIVFDKLKIEG